jgi:hypothetical protein
VREPRPASFSFVALRLVAEERAAGLEHRDVGQDLDAREVESVERQLDRDAFSERSATRASP